MTSFFVGGSQRSGTTLLQSLLCEDASTNPHIFEAGFLRAMVSAYQFGKSSMDGSTAHYFADEPALREFSARWVGEFLEATRAAYAPAEHLVLKEPHLTMLFPELAELVADARFLVILRDPRDTIASMVDVGRKQAALDGPAAQSLFVRRNMVELSHHYKSFYAPVVNCTAEAFRARTAFVKYEALVCQPEVELKKIRDFTGLALDGLDPASTPTETLVVDESVPVESDAWATHLHGKGVSADSLGRYASVLTAEEIVAIEHECADVLQMFKYPATSAPAA